MVETKLLAELANGIQVDPLPEHFGIDENVPHAPVRNPNLSTEDRKLALMNALRYFPKETHQVLAPEFVRELDQYGHIYMYRFRPTNYKMKAYPIENYPAKCKQAACLQLMIMNNLDPAVAQFPNELVTYGGNGSVFNNWAQYHLTMKYLSTMTDEQTLVMNSGHPLGLFPSHKDAPRVVFSNGNMIPMFSTPECYDVQYALGNTIFGQMTAGSMCYIGPQGIVHGTAITLLNAGRKYLNTEDMTRKVYVSSGLGGMSGAQGKASDIVGCIGVIAEVDESALRKRFNQGWIQHICESTDDCIEMIVKLRRTAQQGTSIGFLGNIVALWEALADYTEKQDSNELIVDLGSDQTSLHNPYNGGYYPVQIDSIEKAQEMMQTNPKEFKQLVHKSLQRHVAAINRMVAKGMRFWDYGNSFMHEASLAGADIVKPPSSTNSTSHGNDGKNGKTQAGSVVDFRYPTYFEDIMGDIFSLGFGPFRWVCTSMVPEDLQVTDELAASVIQQLIEELEHERVGGIDKSELEQIGIEKVKQQLGDNLKWIQQAGSNKLVVGSQARILYSDAEGRKRIALAFNEAIAQGKLHGPVVLSRDHHDCSGTSSPFRETSNVTDGSKICADMAIQNAIGLGFRKATWLALHNGGGTGWGKAVNGGFGLVLDGSSEAAERAKEMLFWDVNNGVVSRSWARNPYAEFAASRAMHHEPRLDVTLPNHVDEKSLQSFLLPN